MEDAGLRRARVAVAGRSQSFSLSDDQCRRRYLPLFQRRYWEPEFTGSGLNLAGWTRKLSGKPTITVGSVTLSADMISTLMEGETAAPRPIADLVERLKRHEFDLVAIGRALITNADWPKVVAAGRAASLNPFAVAALAQLA